LSACFNAALAPKTFFDQLAHLIVFDDAIEFINFVFRPAVLAILVTNTMLLKDFCWS
jgi:hypothetical protein